MRKMKQIAIYGRGGSGGMRCIESGTDLIRAWDAQAAASPSPLGLRKSGDLGRRTGLATSSKRNV
jgi:hypothetical protein